MQRSTLSHSYIELGRPVVEEQNPRRRSNSIPWCISFRLILSLRTWLHHLFHALVHACLNELPSELRGFAFKGTDLIYIHCVSNENFAVTVKGFTFVSLLCREVHISYVENISKRRRSLIPVVVANLSVDESFAGVRGPELIRILKFFLWYHGIKHLNILRLFQAC